MLDAFTQLSELHFDDRQLQSQVSEAVAAVDSMLEESPGLNEVVTRLEKRYDELKKLEGAKLPTGDELEKELQQYLRKIDGD